MRVIYDFFFLLPTQFPAAAVYLSQTISPSIFDRHPPALPSDSLLQTPRLPTHNQHQNPPCLCAHQGKSPAEIWAVSPPTSVAWHNWTVRSIPYIIYPPLHPPIQSPFQNHNRQNPNANSDYTQGHALREQHVSQAPAALDAGGEAISSRIRHPSLSPLQKKEVLTEEQENVPNALRHTALL